MTNSQNSNQNKQIENIWEFFDENMKFLEENLTLQKALDMLKILEPTIANHVYTNTNERCIYMYFHSIPSLIRHIKGEKDPDNPSVFFVPAEIAVKNLGGIFKNIKLCAKDKNIVALVIATYIPANINRKNPIRLNHACSLHAINENGKII